MDPLTATVIVVLAAAIFVDRRRTAAETIRRDKQHTDALMALVAHGRDERRELITRIQRPELIPAPPRARTPDAPPRDAAQRAQVGSVRPLQDGPPPQPAEVT